MGVWTLAWPSIITNLFYATSSIIAIKVVGNLGPDAISVRLLFNEGITALINCDWMCPYKEHKFSVIGTNGSLIFDDTRDWSNKLIFNPSIINQDNSIDFYPLENVDVDENEPLKNELQEFINSIQIDTIDFYNKKYIIGVIAFFMNFFRFFKSNFNIFL